MSRIPEKHRPTRPRGRIFRLAAMAGGFTLTALGAVFLFLPGPGLLLLFLGLTLLGTEFLWARRVLKEAGDSGKRLGSVWKSMRR